MAVKSTVPTLFTTGAILLLSIGWAPGADFEFKIGRDTRLTLTLELSPRADRWELTGPNSYRGRDYQLTLEDFAAGSRHELKVKVRRARNLEFAVEEFRASWVVDRSDIFAVWTYNQDPHLHRNYRALKSEPFGDLATPNAGIPYALLAARDGRNLSAFGILSQDQVVYLSGRPDAGSGYQIGLGFTTPRLTNFSETLFMDFSPKSWYELTRDYALWVDKGLGYEPFPVSQACYHPMYDAWYWANDNTSVNLYRQSAQKAKELGFLAYLFDAGWESHFMELAQWLAGPVGNYEAPPDKLPGFAALLRQVKESLGMDVILWLAPYAMGRRSVNYPSMRAAHTLLLKSNEVFAGAWPAPQTLPRDATYDENVNLCPRDPDTGDYLGSLFDRLATTYLPDGYWLDFQDTLPFRCDAPHPHVSSFGSGFNAVQKAIKRSILTRIDRPTVELRYPVANLNNKPYGNLWQSIDFPGDYDGMRLTNLMMRPFSRGIVMGTDEMYWPTTESLTEVAKFAATTVFSGVPAFGADFLKTPHSHNEIVKAWLKFYQDHQFDLVNGEFTPFGDFVFPDQKINSAGKAFVYARYNNRIRLTSKERGCVVYLVNCTHSDSIIVALPSRGDYQVQVLDLYLNSIVTKNLRVEDVLEIREAVPQGGMILLTPQA